MKGSQHRVPNDRSNDELFHAGVVVSPTDYRAVSEFWDSGRKLPSLHGLDHQRWVDSPTLVSVRRLNFRLRRSKRGDLPAAPGTAGVACTTNGDERGGVGRAQAALNDSAEHGTERDIVLIVERSQLRLAIDIVAQPAGGYGAVLLGMTEKYIDLRRWNPRHRRRRSCRCRRRRRWPRQERAAQRLGHLLQQ